LQYSVGAEDTEGEVELDGIPLGAGLTDGIAVIDGIAVGTLLFKGLSGSSSCPTVKPAAAVDFKRHKMPTHSVVIFNFRIMDDEKRSETMICLARNKL
jgi:hypothetical protein